MKKSKVRFNSGVLSLEGVLAIPEGAGKLPGVIICHPHPLYGGSMDNNVVHALFEKLAEASLITFKFNFRGVGESEGDFDQGIGEQKDVDAAISFLTMVQELDPERIGLAGYSAGAAFALPLGSREARIKALAAISPPLSMFDFQFLKTCYKPKLLISGDKDDFTHTTLFIELCQSLPDPIEHISIHGADYFWSGYEIALAERVTAFFTEVL